MVELVFVFVFSLLSLSCSRIHESCRSINRGLFFFFLKKLQYRGGGDVALAPFAAPHFLRDYCSLSRV